jgi:putative transposase
MSCAAPTRSPRPRRCFSRPSRRRRSEVSAFIDAHRDRFGVEPICRTWACRRPPTIKRATGERSERAAEDERLLGRIRELHAPELLRLGLPAPWKALLPSGETVGRDPVKRLMRGQGSRTPSAAASRGGRPGPTRGPGRRPDLVGRDFSAEAPARLWVADLSYLRCWEGLVFFAFVLDAYSRRVVGWQLASTCAPRSCSTRSRWPSGGGDQAPTWSWSITASAWVWLGRAA